MLPTLIDRPIAADISFRATGSYKQFLDAALADPFRVFQEIPIAEVRDYCLKCICDARREKANTLEKAQLAENIISTLIFKKESDEYWLKLLNWYIFSSELWLTGQSLEFATNLAMGPGNEHLGKISKDILGKIKDNPDLYWFVPSVRGFVLMLLSALRSRYGVYGETDWIQIERTVRTVIIHVKDIGLLPRLEKIYSDLKEGQIKLIPLGKSLSSEEERLNRAGRVGILQGAIEILKEAKEEQTQDINVVIGEFLRKKVGLSKNVMARLDYPEHVTPIKDESGADVMAGVRISLDLKTENDWEKQKLVSFLEEWEVEFKGEGFINPRVFGNMHNENEYLNRPYKLGLGKIVNLRWYLSAIPTKGINRLSLRLVKKQEGREVDSTGWVYGYIYVEQ